MGCDLFFAEHFQHTAYCRTGKLVIILPRCREGRIHQPGHQHVIKPGHGDVLSYRQGAVAADTIDCHRHLIICAGNRLQLRGAVQKLLHAPIHILGIISGSDILRAERNAMFFKRVPVSRKTFFCVLIVIRTADKTDPLQPVNRNQMLHAAGQALRVIRDQADPVPVHTIRLHQDRRNIRRMHQKLLQRDLILVDGKRAGRDDQRIQLFILGVPAQGGILIVEQVGPHLEVLHEARALRSQKDLELHVLILQKLPDRVNQTARMICVVVSNHEADSLLFLHPAHPPYE